MSMGSRHMSNKNCLDHPPLAKTHGFGYQHVSLGSRFYNDDDADTSLRCSDKLSRTRKPFRIPSAAFITSTARTVYRAHHVLDALLLLVHGASVSHSLKSRRTCLESRAPPLECVCSPFGATRSKRTSR